MPLTQVGNELQEVDFGELVRSIAQGIADGQRAMDIASVKTLQLLANTPVQIIPEVSEVIVPAPFQVNIPNASGVPGSSSVAVTGARGFASAAEPGTMSALRAGLLPTVYLISEATIEDQVYIPL